MKYYESPAFGQWCKSVYGCDMKQQGMLTTSELDVLFREIELHANSNILDIGCGAGYITSAIAEHFKSNVLGIDIDTEAIEYAKKKFPNNLMLDFQVADANEAPFANDSFDLICFIDTLYFVESIPRLRALLDRYLKLLKPNGKMVICWANYPNTSRKIFDMTVPSPNNTQVGLWCADMGLLYKSFDLTEKFRRFWIKALTEFNALRSEISAEMPEYCKALSNECNHYSSLCEKGDDGGVYRWLYIITKSNNKRKHYAN